MIRSDQLHPITFRVRGGGGAPYQLQYGEYHLLVANLVQALPEHRQEAVWERLEGFARAVGEDYERAMVDAYEGKGVREKGKEEGGRS
jgi:hypothetical protein